MAGLPHGVGKERKRNKKLRRINEMKSHKFGMTIGRQGGEARG